MTEGQYNILVKKQFYHMFTPEEVTHGDTPVMVQQAKEAVDKRLEELKDGVSK